MVNANIAGGKSDAYINEDVNAKIDIDTDGGSLVDVSVTRTNNGNTAPPDPWWHTPNQDYLQVFTNPSSALISIKGNIQRSMSSGFDYAGSGYGENPDLQEVESTRIFLNDFDAWVLEDHNKKVFASWLTVPEGSSKTLALRYQTTYPNANIVVPGSIYSFIFEKQSGVSNSLEATIAAPLGYKWKENDNEVYTYENPNPQGKINLTLTLDKQ